MKTKTMLAAIAMLLLTTTAMNAQDGGRQRQRMNPAEMYTRMADRLAGQMKLDDGKADAFKTLYLDYQTARQNAANPRGLEADNEHVDMDNLTDEKATELIQKRFQTQEAQLAVDKKYYPLFLEILTPAQAVQVFIPRGMGRGGNGQGNGRGGRGGRSGRSF